MRLREWAFLFIVAGCGIAPVSYTHLDVYKRQEADRDENAAKNLREEGKRILKSI